MSGTMDNSGADETAPATQLGGDLGGAIHQVQVAGGGFPPPAPAHAPEAAAAAAPGGSGSVGSVLASQALQPVIPAPQLPGNAAGTGVARSSAAPAPSNTVNANGSNAGGSPHPTAADFAALASNMTQIMSQLASLQAAWEFPWWSSY